VVGVAAAQVDAAGAQVGGFEVGGRAGVVEYLVVGVQQGGAGSPALAAWPDGQERQVVVRDPSGVMPVERGVEGEEPAGPWTGHGAQPGAVTGGRACRVLADGYPQRGGDAVIGGVHGAMGQGVLDVKPEIPGEDPPAGGRVGDEPS